MHLLHDAVLVCIMKAVKPMERVSQATLVGDGIPHSPAGLKFFLQLGRKEVNVVVSNEVGNAWDGGSLFVVFCSFKLL